MSDVNAMRAQLRLTVAIGELLPLCAVCLLGSDTHRSSSSASDKQSKGEGATDEITFSDRSVPAKTGLVTKKRWWQHLLIIIKNKKMILNSLKEKKVF